MACGTPGINCCALGQGRSIMKGVEFPLPKNVSITEYFRKCMMEGTIDSEAPAILSGDGTRVAYTFNALDSLSTRMAKALRQYLGFWTSNNPDGDLVMAYCLPVSEIIPVLILAILKLGGTFLSIPITFAEQHIVTVVGVTRPMVVITESAGPTRARYECVSGLLNVIGIDDILAMTADGDYDDINEVFPLETLARPCQRMACIVYTPGTMDQPMAVRIGNPEILNRCLWQHKTIPYQENEVASVSSGLEDADSIAEIFAPLLAGVVCHLIPKNVLAKSWSLIWRIHDAKISRITLMPPALASLLSTWDELNDEDKLKQPLQSVRYFCVSGDALSFELATKYFDFVCPISPHDGTQNHGDSRARLSSKSKLKIKHAPPTLIHFYGSTEVMSDVTYETFEHCSSLSTQFGHGKVSIGRPIGNTILYVIDDDMKIVEEGSIGEIYIAGACVASGGYVSGSDQRDRERFCANPFSKKKPYSTVYQTEDYGRIIMAKDGSDMLFYEGRTEMTAKVMGKRVDLRDITKCVNETNLVDECCVFCYHPEMDDQALVAVCRLKQGVTEETLDEALKDTISDEYLIPRVFPVEEFRYLPSGRLDKKRLIKLYKYYNLNATPEEWEPLKLQSQLEKTAAKILFTSIAIAIRKPVRYVIKHADSSSMWSLGVNSVTALGIFSKLNENGYTLPIDEFLSGENVLRLVSKIDSKPKRYQESEVHEQERRLAQLSNDLFMVRSLEMEDKEDVMEMLGESYSTKYVLGVYQAASADDFSKFCEVNWGTVLKADLSVVALTRSEPRRLAGAMLVLDGYMKAKRQSKCSTSIRHIWELIESSERGPKEHFVWKKKGTATQIMMMGTSAFVPTMKNILVVALLLEMSKVRAKQLGYMGTMISTANPLILELCKNIFGYEVVEEVPIFKFRSKDKTKPFRLAPEYHKLQVLYKTF